MQLCVSGRANEGALADAHRLASGPLLVNGAMRGGRGQLQIKNVQLGWDQTHKERDATSVEAFRDSSLSPLIRLRLGLKATIDVASAICQKVCAADELLELSRQENGHLRVCSGCS